ncbi:methyltransferase domain-containing protein [Succinimonas amylolytica]|uniref:methyltransferase domain-containing protein n=1 Tax=Succinimonas amylolytica TaxID=83769 RepID=UPI000366139B|nr:class I SAM-dependent methyltransferase [Succinimonas amylolytica]
MLIDTLPAWLKETVTALGGWECPDYKKAALNIRNSRAESLNYIHTYFPRSFREIQDVLCRLDSEAPQFRSDLLDKKELRILSVGCGTGGDVLGLVDLILQAHNFSYDKAPEKAPEVNITVDLVDGNSDAVSLAEYMLAELRRRFNCSIAVNHFIRRFSDEYGFREEAGKHGKYDFIVASKFLQELAEDMPYYGFIEAFRNNLSDTGLLIILTTVDKPSGSQSWSDFIPVILNRETNLASREFNAEIATVYPLPCRAQPQCSNSCCYTRIWCEATNYSYAARLLARKEYAARLVPVVRAGEYFVNATYSSSNQNCYVRADFIQA